MPLPRALVLSFIRNVRYRDCSIYKTITAQNGPLILLPQSRRYSSENGSLSDIRDKLAACPGGSVDLHKCNETGIATMTFNNPKAKNALSGRMVLDLEDNVTDLESWKEGKALLVHGAGSFFSSGGDLKTVWEIANPVSGVQYSSLMQEILQRLSHLPLISACIIQGSALGGGAELALATDFRIMTSSSGLAFIQSRMKVSTGYGGGTMLTKLVGRSRALDILASGRHVGPEEALRIGLADKVVPETENVVDLAKTWLSSFTKASAEAIKGVKSVVTLAAGPSVEESLANETRVFGKLWGSDEHRRILEKVLKK